MPGCNNNMYVGGCMCDGRWMCDNSTCVGCVTEGEQLHISCPTCLVEAVQFVRRWQPLPLPCSIQRSPASPPAASSVFCATQSASATQSAGSGLQKVAVTSNTVAMSTEVCQTSHVVRHSGISLQRLLPGFNKRVHADHTSTGRRTADAAAAPRPQRLNNWLQKVQIPARVTAAVTAASRCCSRCCCSC